MGHNPERDAAAYLGGLMRARDVTRFEGHLVECEDCWKEVSVARLGRSLAERTRELAPAELRESVRASVAATGDARGRGLSWRAPLGIAAAMALVATFSALLVLQVRDGNPAPIAVAIQDYQNGKLPVMETPARGAPDLSTIGFRLTSGGSGALGGFPVDAFAYIDAAGASVFVYMSEYDFPVAAHAGAVSGGGTWRATEDGIRLLCAQRPHPMLILAHDPGVVERVASLMGIER